MYKSNKNSREINFNPPGKGSELRERGGRVLLITNKVCRISFNLNRWLIGLAISGLFIVFQICHFKGWYILFGEVFDFAVTLLPYMFILFLFHILVLMAFLWREHDFISKRELVKYLLFDFLMGFALFNYWPILFLGMKFNAILI